jgi:hypothetical protein
MNISGIFDFVAEQLESRCDFNITQARGTLRIAVKEAGLDPKLMTAAQMHVVLIRILKWHLTRRNVDNEIADQICTEIASLVKKENFPATEGSDHLPEAIFGRLNNT